MKDARSSTAWSRRADALVHGYRPGAPERLGIDYPTLRAINPKLVYLYNGSYGSSGPRAWAAAFHVTGGALCGGGARAGRERDAPAAGRRTDAGGGRARRALPGALQRGQPGLQLRGRGGHGAHAGAVRRRATRRGPGDGDADDALERLHDVRGLHRLCGPPAPPSSGLRGHGAGAAVPGCTRRATAGSSWPPRASATSSDCAARSEGKRSRGTRASGNRRRASATPASCPACWARSWASAKPTPWSVS